MGIASQHDRVQCRGMDLRLQIQTAELMGQPFSAAVDIRLVMRMGRNAWNAKEIKQAVYSTITRGIDLTKDVIEHVAMV